MNLFSSLLQERIIPVDASCVHRLFTAVIHSPGLSVTDRGNIPAQIWGAVESMSIEAVNRAIEGMFILLLRELIPLFLRHVFFLLSQMDMAQNHTRTFWRSLKHGQPWRQT
jgi:hypothetical protein